MRASRKNPKEKERTPCRFRKNLISKTQGRLRLIVLSMLLLLLSVLQPLSGFSETFPAVLVTNSFEAGLEGWGPFWCRESGAVTAKIDHTDPHGGKTAICVSSSSEQDWSLQISELRPVKPGEVYQWDAWLKISGEGSAAICFTTYDETGEVMDWTAGSVEAHADTYGADGSAEASRPASWRRLTTKIAIPSSVAFIRPRLIGWGKATLLADDFRLMLIARLAMGSFPKTLSLSNSTLSMKFDTGSQLFSIMDRRTGNSWNQKQSGSSPVLLNATVSGRVLTLNLYRAEGNARLTAIISLPAEKPELSVKLSGNGGLPDDFQYPQPFVTGAGTDLIVPMNEGISFSVTDPDMEEMWLPTNYGHGLSMPFMGVTNGTGGCLVLVETPDELAKLGMKQILWSSGGSPSLIRRVNSLGMLSGRYDIYQDVMDPAVIRDYTPQVNGAWPRDIVRDESGNWVKGWDVRGEDGRVDWCGVLCDTLALNYAKPYVTKDLKTTPYQARFIDTTTASNLRECYSSMHPMTRTQSRESRMALLSYMSKDKLLVTGSETGFDAAVPYLHYFEGMMSLGPYRDVDAGYTPDKIIKLDRTDGVQGGRFAAVNQLPKRDRCAAMKSMEQNQLQYVGIFRKMVRDVLFGLKSEGSCSIRFIAAPWRFPWNHVRLSKGMRWKWISSSARSCVGPAWSFR